MSRPAHHELVEHIDGTHHRMQHGRGYLHSYLREKNAERVEAALAATWLAFEHLTFVRPEEARDHSNPTEEHGRGGNASPEQVASSASHQPTASRGSARGRGWLFGLLLTLVGCGANDEDWRAVVLHPTTPELEALTERYVAEWREATGLPVSVAADGAPIVIVEPGKVTDSPNASAGTPMLGVDLTHVLRIEIIADARPEILKHEIGHALAEWPAEDGFSHAPLEAQSLMSPGCPSALIDDAALEVVCRYAPCTRWKVEAAP